MTGPILVFGGAHIDRRGRVDGTTVMGASNPGRWFEEPGGGGFNAARTLSRLGHSVRLIAPRGGDAAGDAVSLAAEAAGIDDRPVIFLDRATPSYTAVLDASGDLVVAIADMDLYRLFTPRRFRVRAVRQSLDEASMVLCDANYSAETLMALAEATTARKLPLAAIAISPAKVERLRPALDRLWFLFMNAAEAEALAGSRAQTVEDWPGLLRKTGLQAGVVTSGGRAAIAFQGDHVVRLVPPPIEGVEDVTGAGDAMAAGMLSAFRQGLTLAEALRMGTASAALTIQSNNATAENMTADLLKTTMALVPQPEILS
ncbi:carbohydrate kinase family protein [Rhizobium sp. RU36D]|uniref:carbohydrate kinase family protein n=1 Tax=Rhizobium sp. RU36D TaxID=1907415 RepID=UPI0009D7A1C3|nr:carbohydrate kinase family protein [Rhizobium sp. RU36D]SMC80934.1 Sugar or nucleoside kinase, ribokinase family [Rhizobium sp. RU36D]